MRLEVLLKSIEYANKLWTNSRSPRVQGQPVLQIGLLVSRKIRLSSVEFGLGGEWESNAPVANVTTDMATATFLRIVAYRRPSWIIAERSVEDCV